MSDETKACDYPEDAAHENGNYVSKCIQCGESFIGHKRRFVCKRCASTPPTPDPRERGEARAVVRQHAERMAGYVAQSYDEGRTWEELTRSGFWVGCIDNVLDALAALRAPAPSEAVAWQLVHTRTGQRWTPATDRASVENQQREFAALGATETRIAALVDHHPAPARGVTVTEAMVDKAARYLCDRRNDLMQMYDSDHPLHWHETAVAVLTAALTPDAEGGA